MVAIARDEGSIIARDTLRTPNERGPMAVLSDIEYALKKLIAENKCDAIKGIGIACGGPLNPYKGTIIRIPNLPGWDGLELAPYFAKAFKAPAYLDNDVNIAALGESRVGAGLGLDYVAYLNVGTGVGGGIVINGKVYRGCGNAGEFGHQVILPDGPPCPCGKRGCLESLCSGTSIARRAREYLTLRQDGMLVDLAGGDITKVTGEHVSQAARAGDYLAVRVMRETAECLGIGMANVINILNPRRFILGGGVMVKNMDLLFDRAAEVAKERAMTQLAKDVEIVPALLGEDAGLIGTIYLAREGL